FNPIPYGFCHTLKTPPNGELIFISGQSGGEGKTHSLSHDFDRQVDRVLANLEITLTTHQLRFDDVVKITILIVDHNAEKLEIWSNAMKKRWSTERLPASTLIPVPTLALEGMQIEVDAIAFKAY
ncbi:RidA family protein, partial [Vibrio sp. V39_P1S14PM300]|uniref:RidA family protein n=1 Tax=Vibrio sp. V39_P1S14PM300 TaxID=1938690 RepID=UPI00137333C7